MLKHTHSNFQYPLPNTSFRTIWKWKITSPLHNCYNSYTHTTAEHSDTVWHSDANTNISRGLLSVQVIHMVRNNRCWIVMWTVVAGQLASEITPHKPQIPPVTTTAHWCVVEQWEAIAHTEQLQTQRERGILLPTQSSYKLRERERYYCPHRAATNSERERDTIAHTKQLQTQRERGRDTIAHTEQLQTPRD